MNENSTLTECKFNFQNLKPKIETLQNILMFAALYQVERLSNGEIAQYFLN
ncbi:MAG: hypothetical protein LBB53_05405 [Prevotellaceae bacterium]|jgi:hypothetical protein|nr:hypothetical protein [Prevotellaceae bacterium]